MITTEPVIDNGARLNTSQAARLLEISRQTLRKYTREGLIRCGRRRLGSRDSEPKAFYSGFELKRFWRSTV